METFANRLKTFMAYKKIKSFSALARELNYDSPSKLTRLDKFKESGEPNNPSIDIPIDITNKFVELSLEWLLTGNGKMLKTGENIPSAISIVSDIQAGYKKGYIEKDVFDKMMKISDSLIKSKDDQIKILEDQLSECGKGRPAKRGTG